MLFQRFFETISEVLPDRLLGDMDALARLNPEKFYVENVRSVLGVSTVTAQRICDTAVRQGVFRRFVEVVCPDGSVAASADHEESLPEMVRCWSEKDGQYEETMLPTHELRKAVFYRLNDDQTARPLARAG
jgi:hypothetical protein